MRTTWTLPLRFLVKECILTIIIKEEEDRSDRVGSEIGWLLEMQYIESDGSNLGIYSVTNRKPVEISKNIA